MKDHAKRSRLDKQQLDAQQLDEQQLDEQQLAPSCSSSSDETRRTTVRSDEEKHYLAGRLNKIIGQVNGIKRMIDDDRYCEDVLVQLSAVNSAIRSVSCYILDKHLNGCIVKEIKEGDESAADEIMLLFKRFIH